MSYGTHKSKLDAKSAGLTQAITISNHLLFPVLRPGHRLNAGHHGLWKALPGICPPHARPALRDCGEWVRGANATWVD